MISTRPHFQGCEIYIFWFLLTWLLGERGGPTSKLLTIATRSFLLRASEALRRDGEPGYDHPDLLAIDLGYDGVQMFKFATHSTQIMCLRFRDLPPWMRNRVKFWSCRSRARRPGRDRPG